MAKTITFTFDGMEYCLGFTRRTVQMMENEGFNVQQIDAKIATMLPQLFAGAFKAHHRFTKPSTIDAIYDALPNKQELYSKLIEMYNEPLEALMADPEETEGNAVQWTANW